MQSHDSPIKKGFIGESSYPGNESGDVAISPNGNLAAVTGVNSNSPILIVDISDPAQPTEIGRFNPGWYSFGIEFIDNNTIAFGSAINGLKIVDISSPSSPTTLSTFNTNGNNTVDITFGINTNTLFLVDDDKGVECIGISDVNNPSLNWTYGNADGSDPGFAKATELIQISNTLFAASFRADWNDPIVRSNDEFELFSINGGVKTVHSRNTIQGMSNKAT